MKTRKIAILVGVIVCLGIASSISAVSAVESPTLVEGHYVRVSWQMFQNHLWTESTGLCVQGMHTYGGPTITDLVVVGGGQSSNVALQGYWPNMTNHIPVDYHNDAEYEEKIRDSVKFLNPNSGNMELIYASGYYNDGTYSYVGKIIKQDIKNPTKDSENQLVPDWYVSTTGEVYALALGNFYNDGSDLEVAGVTTDGKVYVINNIQTSGSAVLTEDFSDVLWTRSDTAFIMDHVKTPIAAIDDLDGINPTISDIVVGHYQNVTAISTNTSNRIIWDVTLDYFISDLVVVDDINSDGLKDVVASTNDLVYLLDGADGSILSSYGPSTYYRDVEVYNSTAIISGGSDGIIFVWDIDTSSPNFGSAVITADWDDYDINDLLVVEDLNEDGVNEFAVGADRVVGVVYGSNLTTIWWRSPIGNWNMGGIDVYDMALLADLSGDGFGDLAVTGYSDHGAVFVYSTYGVLQFIPDLTGYGTVDSACEDSGHTFVFTATATQSQSVPIITAKINIDGANTTLSTDETDWANGVTYTYSSTFGDGEHTYYFYFADNHGNTYQTGQQTFKVGNCNGGGLEIPGAGIWMLLASIGLGIAITLLVFRKRFIR